MISRDTEGEESHNKTVYLLLHQPTCDGAALVSNNDSAT